MLFLSIDGKPFFIVSYGERIFPQSKETSVSGKVEIPKYVYGAG